MKLMLRHKVIWLASLSALFPVLLLLLLTSTQNLQMSNIVTDEINKMSREHLAQIAQDISNLCSTANELIQNYVARSHNVAKKIVRDQGGFSLDKETITWDAVNQNTFESLKITIPKMKLGQSWLGTVHDISVAVPLVDDIKKMMDCNCTVFQRMNDRGDMLRIATNVVNPSTSERIIGTFIPAVNDDGSPNSMIATVLKGETYRGRSRVFSTWHLSFDEPIQDSEGRVIGVLHVGIKQEAVESLRKAIYNTKVGKDGYVWVIGGKGKERGHYIISQRGERDGEDILNVKDDHGNFFVQTIVNNALTLHAGEVADIKYPWKNPGDKISRNKIAVFAYFEPWDWIIGAGMYEDDYYEVLHKVHRELNKLFLLSLLGGLIFLGIAVWFAVKQGKRISQPITEIISIAQEIARGNLHIAKKAVEKLKTETDEAMPNDSNTVALQQKKPAGDETHQLRTAVKGMTQNLYSLLGQVQRSGIQVTTSTTQIAASARELEAAVTQQAASTSEVAATSREISATSQELVTTMHEVSEAVLGTAAIASAGRSDLNGMETTINQLMNATGSISSKLSIIHEKANNIDSVITAINKVADQTNLLSLNASIEAEKAGEYGVGFAVVAREIRRLADQTAVSTLDIEHMVKEMQSAVSSGVMEMDKFTEEVRQSVRNIGNISHQLEKIIEQVQVLPPRFGEVSQSMQLQSQGAQQISEAMVQINEAIQQTSASLREFNTAAEQLQEAGRGLQHEVSRFRMNE